MVRIISIRMLQLWQVKFDANKSADADLLVHHVVAGAESVGVDLVAKNAVFPIFVGDVTLELLQTPQLLLLDLLNVFISLLGIHDGGPRGGGISLAVLSKNSVVKQRNVVAALRHILVSSEGRRWQ